MFARPLALLAMRLYPLGGDGAASADDHFSQPANQRCRIRVLRFLVAERVRRPLISRVVSDFALREALM